MKVLKATIIKSREDYQGIKIDRESISLLTDVKEPPSYHSLRQFPLMIFLVVDGGRAEPWIEENFPGIEIDIFEAIC